jgi:hypothetical protein
VGISDKLRDLEEKAEGAAVERKNHIKGAVEKAEAAADERPDGKYHGQLAKGSRTTSRT